jgi:hypothetical protein
MKTIIKLSKDVIEHYNANSYKVFTEDEQYMCCNLWLKKTHIENEYEVIEFKNNTIPDYLKEFIIKQYLKEIALLTNTKL